MSGYLIIDKPVPCNHCDSEAVYYDSYSLYMGCWCRECYEKHKRGEVLPRVDY